VDGKASHASASSLELFTATDFDVNQSRDNCHGEGVANFEDGATLQAAV